MLKKFKINKLLLFIPLTTLAFCFNSPKDDDQKMSTIMISVKNALSYLQYSPKPINEAYSQDVYKQYFDMVDPSKRYFLASDMKDFSQYKNKLGDYLISGNLTFYKATVDRLYQRVDEIELMTQDIFKKPIDLNENDSLILEPKDKEYPADKQAQYNEWKKYIKYNILQEMATLSDREETQKAKKDSVQKFHLKDTIKLNILTPEAKKIKATNEVKDLVADTFRRFKKRKRMNWFTVYMNAYTLVFDPHSNYFSPKDKEDFDSNFSGQFIGIGAIIQEKKGFLYLGELVAGAPAWKSKQLNEGDKILKIKSEPNQDAVNVQGMLSEEAVQLIRGEKGTPVTLTVEKKDKSIKDVTLMRDEITIEDTFARSVSIQYKNGKKYGYINLPGFNADFNNPKGRNASDDIKAELIKLKAQKVEGIILDLRNNGGGSLTEVGDIMGLFMDGGPYVQVKNGDGKIQTLRDKSTSPLWTGPLVIMQNELSASASEILAGAMQDYGRAVILGSPQSYGKGTVQTFVDLNRFLNTNDDFGSVKLTIQKFYRITGESTQIKGVNSDISLKDFFTNSEIGERFSDYALPWDKISPTDFKKMNILNIAALQKQSAERIKNNANYRLLQESTEWKNKLENEKSITLNENKFDALMKKRKEELKIFKPLENYDNKLSFIINPNEVAREKTDSLFAKKTKAWTKNLSRDFYLDEAVHVVSEMK